MAVVIPLKLVYTPVDDTVTAIRNYQVPSTKSSSRMCVSVSDENGEGGPEAGALGAEAVGVGGCARLPSSAAGMRSVSSARLRCVWTLWAVSGNPSGIPGSTMGLATGTSARLRAGHDVCRAPGSAARWGRAGRKLADARGRCDLLRGR